MLTRCRSVPDTARAELDEQFGSGARVVAVATRPADGETRLSDDEHDLDLCGFLTFLDPRSRTLHTLWRA